MFAASTSATLLAMIGLLAQPFSGKATSQIRIFWPTVRLFTEEKNNYVQPHNFDDQKKEAEKGWWGNEKDDTRFFRFNGDREDQYTAETFYLGYFASATKKDDMPETMTGDNERIDWQKTANPWITGTPTLKVECTASAKAATLGKPEKSTTVHAAMSGTSTRLQTDVWDYYPATKAIEVKLKPDNLPTGASTLKTGAVEVHCTSVENKPFPAITATATSKPVQDQDY
ncbi:hypothetical protein IAT40_002217 [Kwoniella sp. CBS 6097]